MQRETITVDHPDIGTVTVTVAEATVRQGMIRTRLQIEAEQSKDDDLDLFLLRRYTYPDLIAATVDAGGIEPWPIPFAQFLALPESIVAPWETAVYRLNPHWLPSPPDEGPEKNE